MNDLMELRRRTWIAALRLAVVISIAAALLAVAVSSAGSVNEIAIVLPVIVVAFVASWVQSGRVQRRGVADPTGRTPAPTA